MGFKNKIAQYREYQNGVSHCTFNPEGPGVVHIHLVPRSGANSNPAQVGYPLIM